MGSVVCVTGAAGYIGSSLVKKLLQKGHTVHATLRNLGDESKVELLKSIPGAESRLLLFEADIYEAEKFEPAIKGCEFVFLVATPLQHNVQTSQFKDTTEAAVAAVRRILQSCEESGSVRRVIYTGSVTAASPVQEDGSGFGDFIDESCWTPLNLSYAYCEDFEKGYISSKTLSEKELLCYNNTKDNKRIEVVSLVCGLVGGDTILPYVPASVQTIVSPLTGEPMYYRQLKFLESLLGLVPLVHIDDICEAHAFCMESSSMTGRFICARAFPMVKEFGDYFKQMYPKLEVDKEAKQPQSMLNCSSTKLIDMGFKYNYDLKEILDESLECAKRLGGVSDLH